MLGDQLCAHKHHTLVLSQLVQMSIFHFTVMFHCFNTVGSAVTWFIPVKFLWRTECLLKQFLYSINVLPYKDEK